MKFSGTDIAKLAGKYETPFYFSSQEKLISNIEKFKTAFSRLKNFNIYFSVKTNFESEVLKTIKSCGCGAEIAGPLGFHSATKAKFKPNEIIVDGPVKHPDFLKMIISKGINCMNVESVDEAEMIDKIARKLGVKQKIGMRIDTHAEKSYYDNILNTYKRKFGIQYDVAEKAMKKVSKLKNVDFRCVHTHIGSQLYVPEIYGVGLEKMFKLIDSTKSFTNIDEINMGGGFPTKSIGAATIPKNVRFSKFFEKFGLTEKKLAPPIEMYANAMTSAYDKLTDKYNTFPSISVEPGRSIVADTAILVGKVVLIKKPWVFVDISINDIAEQTFFMVRDINIVGKENSRSFEEVNITGPTLATNDVIKLRENLPKLKVGDIVTVHGVGAYSIARASQFTRPRSAYYFKFTDGRIKLIRKAEKPEDVIRCQIW